VNVEVAATERGGGLVDVRELAAQLRVDSIRAATDVASGHVTSSLSAADLMAVLLAGHLRYDWQKPTSGDNDHLIFSKGHASPLLYSVFRAAGVLSAEELVGTYRRLGSRLQGHPTPELPWVDVATGSLGQGLPIGVGIALAGKYLDQRNYHVWVLCGDSEMTEGSIWEALDRAGQHRLDNLTVIVDVNRLGQRGPTELQWDMDAYAQRVAAFGITPIVVDGHDLSGIDAAYAQARASDGPTAVLARTVKGRGVSEIEDLENWHGKALPADLADRAIRELGGPRDITVACRAPRTTEAGWGAAGSRERHRVVLPQYAVGDEVATRKAYGAALAAIGARTDIVAMDGEVSNSTHADAFEEAYPQRYFEAYIAECQLIATAVGMSVRHYRPFASTFAAFVSRAYDFIRMAAVSRANIVICGSHAGVEIGEDGPSQMALEDLAALRAVHGSTVLYPADATACTQLVGSAADRDGIVYLRTTRGAYPVLYPPDASFPVGGSKVLRSSADDVVTIVGAGVTVHTALAAADELAADGTAASVIDAYSVKPIDTATLRAAAEATGGRLIVVEDHHPEGGLASAVLEALAAEDALDGLHLEHLAVRTMPGSATSAQQLAAAGIDADAIVAAARRLLALTDPLS
jgi:transketolase